MPYMPSNPTCSSCGAELPPGATQCTRCLIELALGASLDPIAAAGSPTKIPPELGTGPYRATVAAPPISEKPGDHIGRYKLLEQISEGGCGVVYVAEQEQPIRRREALKIIKMGMDTRQ